MIWQGHIDYFKKEIDSCCFCFSCLCTRIGEGNSMRRRPTTLSIQKSRCLLYGRRVFGLGGKLCRSYFSCFRVLLVPSAFCAMLRLCFVLGTCFAPFCLRHVGLRFCVALCTPSHLRFLAQALSVALPGFAFAHSVLRLGWVVSPLPAPI